MKRIYIVRHGQTYINRYNKMQGWCDTPLTQKGITGAEQAGETLRDVPFDIALSSDLKRASDTCDIIIEHNQNHDELQHIASPYFREQFYGYFEGMDSDMAWQMIGGPHGYQNHYDLLKNESIDTAKDWLKEADPFHDAENAAEYWARLDKGFKLISELDGAENILLVTHGFTIRSIAARYSNFDISVSPRNASITMMTMTNQKMEVTSYNKMEL
ncbi:histidine phosphatase family protein [Lactobacillus sp. ESL0684]|uniref:histidine phosphatase family protein n=1 Tax=unclassified Lactobacillus TaxID=2620435 RepID=UPI0023F96A4A|nr:MULTISPECIES: histidine phosphatase family protein [unclassified Lactobacillus]WEV39650.1 histidine phosphatase family protein [Lactobacillus sp. ESL0681]WEV43819.1 histidine phosphatase family protein [Lactobacillus sp. ESL0684]